MIRSGLWVKLLIICFVLSLGIVVVYYIFRQYPIGARTRFAPEGGLPPGYVWEHTQGPDFDVYHARGPDGQNAGIGIYLGNHPNFPYQENLPCEKGKLLGTEVCWVLLDGAEEVRCSLYRTTLLRYRYGVYAPIYVHIWIYANDLEELQSFLGALQHLHIRPAVSILELLRNLTGY